MVVTRGSARVAASEADSIQKPSEDKEKKSRPSNKGKTSHKRAREAQDDTPANDPPPAKRATKDTPKPAGPPAPSSDSNRDANGNQEVFWLLKAEPLPRYENGVNVAFSIDDLEKCTEPEPWTGVRNPVARNNMQAMRKGDLGFFYHSNAKPSGVVGILRVVNEARVDETAFDSKDPYYDAKSDREKPKWFCVEVEFVSKFDAIVDLHRIKSHAAKGEPLEGMQLVSHSRLSVNRVRKEEWDFVLQLANHGSVDGG